MSSATKWELDDQGFNLVEFYHNIILTFNERIDWESDYELNKKTETWIKDTLRWWREYVYDIHLCPANVTLSGVPGLQKGVATVSACGEDSDGEESDLSKVLASRRMNTDDFDSIDPALRGLRARRNPTRKSYHQPIFTSGSRCAPFTDATSAAPYDESLAPTGSLNQATLGSQTPTGAQTQASASRAASQDIDFQASTDTQAQALSPQPMPERPKERTSGAAAPNPGSDPSQAASQDIDSQASADTQAQALPPQPKPKRPKERTNGAAAPNPRSDPSQAASQDIDFQASTDAQAQALPPRPKPKRPKERTNGAAAPNPGFNPIIDGELTPHSSPAPKRPKQSATMIADKSAKSAPRSGIRKSTRKKH